MKNRLDRGFSLIELLITVAIIGLLASILIPNLLISIQKARQKRTLTDIRGIGTAWMAWLTDEHGAASAGAAAKVFDATGLTPVTHAALLQDLRPSDSFFYAQDVPELDSWGTPFRFFSGSNSPTGAIDTIMICSAGGDKTFSECAAGSIPTQAFIATDFDRDIVWANGFFVSWPEGLGSE